MLNKSRTSLNSNKLKSMYYRCIGLKSMLFKITKIRTYISQGLCRKKNPPIWRISYIDNAEN